MKNRKTLGHQTDTAESAALTIGDPRATERIIEACDYEPENNLSAIKEFSLNDEQCKLAAVERARRALGNTCAKVVQAYLNHKSWKNIGIPERTFHHALKKVKKYFQPHKTRVK